MSKFSFNTMMNELDAKLKGIKIFHFFKSLFIKNIRK